MNDEPKRATGQKPSEANAIVSAQELKNADVDSMLASLETVDCGEVWTLLQGSLEEEEKANPRQAEAIRLLAGIASYSVNPDHPTEPFTPFVIWRDGRRSSAPSDLKAQQLDALAEFAPTVSHLGLRARIADVVWLMQRRRRDMAELAIESYCDCIERVRVGEAKFTRHDSSALGGHGEKMLARAARISHLTGWNSSPSTRLREVIVNLRSMAYQNAQSSQFIRIAEVDMNCRISPLTELAKQAEELALRNDIADHLDTKIQLWEMAAKCHRGDRDSQNDNRCMKKVAEWYTQKAKLESRSAAKSHFIHKSIQILRNIPETKELRSRLESELRHIQPKIIEEAATFSTEIDLSDIVRTQTKAAQKFSLEESLILLLLAEKMPSPNSMRESIIEESEEFFIQYMMPMTVYDYQGRITFQSPGMDSSGGIAEESMRYKMAFHRSLERQVTVDGKINPLRRLICQTHPVSTDLIISLIGDSPFIPLGHEYLFGRAIAHFLGGHDVEAASILIPQLENSLRHILFVAGADATTVTDEHGIQTEASLSALLNPQKSWRTDLEKIISPQHIHEIDLLFDFAGGPSIRNQFAHGKIPAGIFWSHECVYATWLIIHLISLPVMGEWGDIGKILARVEKHSPPRKS